MAGNIDDYLVSELEFDLSSSDLGTRRHALVTLSNQTRSRRIFEIFQKAMTSDPHPELQYLARRFYNEWRSSFEEKPEEAVPDVFADGDLDEQAARQSFVGKSRKLKLDVAKQIAERRDKRALPVVLQALAKEDDPFVQASLVKALGAVGDASHITALQGYLKSPDSRVRANTVEALEMIGDDLIFPVLVPMLQDPDNRVKGNTIKALMSYDEEAARDLIRMLARSSKEGRRDSACHCLSVASAPWVEEIVLEMLRREPSDELQKKECELLAEKGGEAAAGYLVTTLPTLGSVKGRLFKFAIEGIAKRLGFDTARLDELAAAWQAQGASPALEVTTESGAEAAPAPPAAPAGGSPPAEARSDLDTSRWDMEAISEALPKLRSAMPRVPGTSLPPAGRPSRRGTAPEPKAGSPAAAAASRERASWLLPAVAGVVLLSVGLVASLVGKGSGGGSTATATPTVRAGQPVELTCRVRFVDSRKSTMTLASGQVYYLARFAAGTDLSAVKVGDMVKVTGTQSDEKNFDAAIVDATGFEVVPPKGAP